MQKVFQMKKFLLFICFVVKFNYLICQNNISYNISISYGCTYNFIKNANPRYFKDNRLGNKYNYLMELDGGIKFRSIYINLGMSYSTKNYFEEYNPGAYKSQDVFYLKYLKFPIFAGYNFFTCKNITTSFNTGIILIKSFDYKVDHYKDWVLKTKNVYQKPVDYKLGSSWLLGFRINYLPVSWFSLFMDIQYDFKFNMDFVHHEPKWVFVGTKPGIPLYALKEEYTNLLDNRHSIVCKFGLNFNIFSK